jgi:hypothetical protein
MSQSRLLSSLQTLGRRAGGSGGPSRITGSSIGSGISPGDHKHVKSQYGKDDHQQSSDCYLYAQRSTNFSSREPAAGHLYTS